MPSESKPTNAPVIAFTPTTSPTKLSTEKDNESAHARDIRLTEICKETSGALQELRHGIIYALSDTLDELDLDTMTLAEILDERPSVVRDLRAGEMDETATERLIDYLERLHLVPLPGL